jgi:hypothetical protein
MECVRRGKEVGEARWRTARMKSRESIPLEGRPGRPYIEFGEFGGQVIYRERGSPDRVVVSLREGETS